MLIESSLNSFTLNPRLMRTGLQTMAVPSHSVIFPMGVVHRVENGWGLTEVVVVLLNGLIW